MRHHIMIHHIDPHSDTHTHGLRAFSMWINNDEKQSFYSQGFPGGPGIHAPIRQLSLHGNDVADLKAANLKIQQKHRLTKLTLPNLHLSLSRQNGVSHSFCKNWHVQIMYINKIKQDMSCGFVWYVSAFISSSTYLIESVIPPQYSPALKNIGSIHRVDHIAELPRGQVLRS